LEFEKWLKNTIENIKKEILNERDFSFYVNDITLFDCGELKIWKKIGRDETRVNGNTTTVTLAPIVSEMVTPSPIRLKFDNKYQTLYSTDQTRNTIVNIAKTVSIEENKTVIQILSNGAKTFGARTNILTYDALQPAIEYIKPGGNYPDTLLINPFHFPKMIRQNGFTPYSKLSPDFVALKGRHFKGLFNELSVYQTPNLAENEIILYKKQYVEVKTTPLDLNFNSVQNPESLYFSEDLYVWSVDDFAIAKVSLEKTANIGN